MKLAIHQPNYLPWAGYFHKMASADAFLILDTVQFVKSEYENRCKIKTPNGEQLLSVPVSLANARTMSGDVKISEDADLRRYHMAAIERNYSNTPYYNDYKNEIAEVYEAKWQRLAELNIHLIKKLKDWLKIDTPITLASEFGEKSSKGTDLLISYCKDMNADTYLSGIGGKNYLASELFENNDIVLEYQHYESITYPQRFGEFIPNLSVIDLLFNCGDESLPLIMGESR